MTRDQQKVRELYKKLLSLYPRAFRERLGESMQQTFNDLYNERKQQPEQGLTGFVLWMFVETAVGIVKEHALLIKGLDPMKNIFMRLRLPAIISFFIILPFIFLEFIIVMVKGLNFDPRDALDSVVVFGILWLGVAAIVLILRPLVESKRAGNKTVENAAPAHGNTTFANPRSAATISIVLALPFVALLSLLLLGIEPPLGPLAHVLRTEPDQPNYLSLLIMIGTLLLAVAAGLIARVPIVHTMRAGGSLLAHPVNLILAASILSFITMLVIGLIVDQFPCWLGVPNCD